MEPSNLWLREEALQLAARTYGSEHPPQAIVDAAEIFLEFLEGDNIEV